MNLPQIPQKFRKPLIWVGYPAFALMVMLVTVYASLPRDRIKDKLEAALSADPMSGAPAAIGMDVSAGDLSLTLFTGAGLRAKDIVLRTRPMDATAKPARILIDDVTVHVGLIGLLFNRPTYRWKAHAFSGEVSGKISMSPAEQKILIEVKDLVLSGIPAIQQALSLPIEGTLSGKLDAVAPKNLAANLDGTLEVALDNAVVGDGKAKLTVPGDPFLSQGITFPKLRLGKITGQVVMEKGKARLENWSVHSPDGDATLEGYVELHDPLGMSQMHGYLKFKPSDALIKREPTVELMNNALASAKRPDGYIGFQLTGPLTAIFYLPNANPPPGVTSKSLPPSAPSTAPPPVVPPANPSVGSVRLPPPPSMPSEPSEPEPAAPPPPPLPASPIGPPTGTRGNMLRDPAHAGEEPLPTVAPPPPEPAQ